MSDEHQQVIWRGELLQKLARAAQIRSAVTLLSMLLSLLLAGMISQVVPLNDAAMAALALFAIFGMPSVVSFLMTIYYCDRAVLCPACRKSLWDCGTGNFKPRRMRIREGVVACPHCQSPIR